MRQMLSRLAYVHEVDTPLLDKEAPDDDAAMAVERITLRTK
jgi:hypothetical protein